jgi:hypothetical protein
MAWSQVNPRHYVKQVFKHMIANRQSMSAPSNTPHTSVKIEDVNRPRFDEAKCMITQVDLSEMRNPVVNKQQLHMPGVSCPVFEVKELLNWYHINLTWPDTRMRMNLEDIVEVDRGDGAVEDGVYRPLPYVQKTIEILAVFKAREQTLLGFRLEMMMQTQISINQVPWLYYYWHNYPLTCRDIYMWSLYMQNSFDREHCPSRSGFVDFACRKVFRIEMCKELEGMRYESEKDPRYTFWRAHPPSISSGDDDEVIGHFRHAFEVRAAAGNPISKEQIPFPRDFA